LNLDQVMAAVTAGRGEYDLAAFYSSPLGDEDGVRFRQEVFSDLEPKAVREAIGAFAAAMRSVRGLLRQELTYKYQRESWFFEAAETYGRSVTGLVASFEGIEVRSRGLLRFKGYLAAYVGSASFQSLVAESARIREALAAVRYNLHIGDGRVTVSPPDPAPDYSAQIDAAFERFRRGAVRDYLATFSVDPDLNHVGILDRIALLYPDTFGALDEFCDRHREFVDPTIAAFDREVQFYMAYLEFIDRLRAAGLPFCSPRVTEGTKATCARETFDIALASKLVTQGAPVVRNDFRLQGTERVIVVTGPNQGGKTTFARAFGQLHYLASLGCPVPGEEAELPLTDTLFTHFGREEQLADRRGRLEDDLLRVRAILDAATPHSVLVLNEVFTSTTLLDSVFLSTEVLRRIEALDLLCVWVTFVDELAGMSERTVSMVSNVLPEDPTVRTFKITRRPADGHAYAAAIAAKYGVNYARLKARLPA
jgi:DNA mismatch repair protein MutS